MVVSASLDSMIMNSTAQKKTPLFRWILLVLDLIILGAIFLLLLTGQVLASNGLMNSDQSMIRPFANLILSILGAWNLFSQSMHLLMFFSIPKWLLIIRLLLFILSICATAYIIYNLLVPDSVTASQQVTYGLSPMIALSYFFISIADFLVALINKVSTPKRV